MTGATENSEYARMFGRDETAPIGSGEDIMVRVATLKTATSCVEVNELSWKEPGALIFSAAILFIRRGASKEGEHREVPAGFLPWHDTRSTAAPIRINSQLDRPRSV